MRKTVAPFFKKKPDSVGANDTFVRLIQSAQEDAKFSATLCGILQQPSFHRKSLLNTMASGMKLDGVDNDMVNAVSALADDEVAKAALELLAGPDVSIGKETQPGIDPPDMTVCPGCLSEHTEGTHFCSKCGAPLSAFATVGPLERIHAQGYAYRRAASGPTSRIVVIGMWLLILPQIFMLTLSIPSRGFVFIFSAAYAILLYRVTTNYIRSRTHKGDDT
jgi:hypothetical protein